MDVVQKTKDLIKLALHEKTSENERNEAAIGAARLIDKYDLLGTTKPIDVAANILEKLTNPLFAEGVAERAEKIASTFDRVMGSVKKVSDHFPKGGGDKGRSGGRGRRYGGRQ